MRRSYTALFLLLIALALPICAQSSPYNALGDTLTVIQQPILNIPAIHIPGEQMPIICTAPASTTNWQAWLLHGSKSIPLQITSTLQLEKPTSLAAQYQSFPGTVFELYDHRVSASGDLDDTAWNAVQVIPSRTNQLLHCPYYRCALCRDAPSTRIMALPAIPPRSWISAK
jgi:hypothetical protein